MSYLITAAYRITSKTPWGSLDGKIRKAFNGHFDGCGTWLASAPPVRDYTGIRKKKKSVEKIVAKLKTISGVKVNVKEIED